jgi:protein TonB
MKTTLYSLVLVLFIFGLNTFAQEEKPDVMAEPVGGIEQIIKNVVYPKVAKEAGIEGKVLIKAIVDEKGNVIKTEVEKSVNKDLDEAAIDAVKKTKFTPALKDDKPIETTITIPIMFRLS